MPPDDIGDDVPTQETVSHARRVRSGDVEMVAVEEDGVVTLHKLRIVPSALWNSPHWRRCALPDWAANIEDPTGQFLALVVVLAAQTQDAIDALHDILADLREARRQAKAGAAAADVATLIDKVGVATRALAEKLDR